MALLIVVVCCLLFVGVCSLLRVVCSLVVSLVGMVCPFFFIVTVVSRCGLLLFVVYWLWCCYLLRDVVRCCALLFLVWLLVG